ncbi:MAG: hypothetical protein AAFV53_39490 [Myxococcota bacterium]
MASRQPERPVISPENQPTVIAVAFTLALLSLSLNFVNFQRTNQLIYRMVVYTQRDNKQDRAETQQLRARIRVLEDRLAAFETLNAAAREE